MYSVRNGKHQPCANVCGHWRLQVLDHPLFWNAERRMKLIDDVKEAFGSGAQLRHAIDARPLHVRGGQGTTDGWDWEKHWWVHNSGDWRLKKGIAANVFWDASPVRGKGAKFVHANGSRFYGERSVRVVSAGPTPYVSGIFSARQLSMRDWFLRSARRRLCGRPSFPRGSGRHVS